ncbi:restriction endonuclease [Segatella copri]|uniref:site-specific DNA-methyltransferase (adenine-specific) n=1 Tax=Segatella copri TaxID=165179 RepID=A0AA92TYZ5_9BACT|nr:TaqI-like C-terminal specificity domain-containing protein [Segatella copri]RGW43816.1 restriction endonuclease [Segatella copri]
MNYKEIIESKYNREAWQQLLHDIFLSNVSFWRSPKEVKANSRLAKNALNLGKISLSDGEALAIYEVELSDKVDIERNRAGIRDMLTKDWRDMGYAGAFLFCYRKNESVLRFSYVSETWGFNKDGIYEKLSTNTKRFTYLLGEGRGCRTAIEQFGALKNSKLALSDVTAAFSVEALTKQFYKDLYEWYQWAVDPASGVYFPNNTSIEADDREDIETKIIRLITRIMFVWFIKQKELVPNKIFDVDFLETILKDFDPNSAVVGNYYNAILQNLFFGTLNRAIEDEQGNKRKFATNVKKDIKTLYRYAEMFTIREDEVIKLFSEVPFLNGGLFECLDKTKTIDGVEQAYNYDGFSRNDKKFADGRYRNRAVVPNVLFFEPERGLISILSRYNFTIEENSPEEQQVALDPELLGKVFENLLGAYNPETKETARNQSGSFYTPREIVNYMVDESLISYLGNTAFVRSLFSPEFVYDKTKEDDYKTIADKLKTIKILDPACGSGAFPMGLLNRMMEILCHITPDENIYEMKLAIIENCIYGSDIQSIAAQITKLRFFISLICNCEKDATKPNFGIPTLPNLETKFVAANSLIAKKKQVSHNLFENPEIEPTKKELTEIRHEHFSAKTAYRKSTLREKDKQLREKLAKLLAEDNDFAPEDAKQLAAWNPYDQNAVAEFFDPAWMFGVNDGFDIVIGNPPILRGRDIKRYGYNWANLWLINTHNGIRGKLERVHIEDYPAIKAHLDQYWDRISKRADKGDTPYNLRNCAYLEDFSKQQIVWIELSDEPKFSYAQNVMSVNTVFFLTGEHVLHILGLLNSKLITWYFKHCIGTTSGVGTNRWLKYTIEQIPIAPINIGIEQLVNQICSNLDTTIDGKIDDMVCKQYGLDEEEICFIVNH